MTYISFDNDNVTHETIKNYFTYGSETLIALIEVCSQQVGNLSSLKVDWCLIEKLVLLGKKEIYMLWFNTI